MEHTHYVTRIQGIPVYQFDELNTEAKKVARDWWRQGVFKDSNDWEHIYSDTAECGKILGIDLCQIYFAGFSSQGDGACFEGSYTYAPGCAQAIRRYAPKDKTLAAIADRLVVLQKRCFYRLEAVTRQRGHYNHSGCMTVDVRDREGFDISADTESDLTDILRSFADWIYSQLQQEYEYQMANEQVDDNIRANEYEFTENGERL